MRGSLEKKSTSCTIRQESKWSDSCLAATLERNISASEAKEQKA